ncbi:hypothetical protein V500_10464 [Pseudogymnoascus sp. VKM F-4518 (FW-2643)]|nr:hypothetical protein V500_10464 [Pseudogymnoascus sp. VKM F-4518 (FW-2643)]
MKGAQEIATTTSNELGMNTDQDSCDTNFEGQTLDEEDIYDFTLPNQERAKLHPQVSSEQGNSAFGETVELSFSVSAIIDDIAGIAKENEAGPKDGPTQNTASELGTDIEASSDELVERDNEQKPMEELYPLSGDEERVENKLFYDQHPTTKLEIIPREVGDPEGSGEDVRESANEQEAGKKSTEPVPQHQDDEIENVSEYPLTFEPQDSESRNLGWDEVTRDEEISD